MLGADSFQAWYGVRFEIDVAGRDNDEFDQIVSPFETESDSRMVAARSVGLDSWFGRDTDGATYFLTVGSRLGELGYEHNLHERVIDGEMTEHQMRIRGAMIKAGIEGQLHLQFCAQY